MITRKNSVRSTFVLEIDKDRGLLPDSPFTNELGLNKMKGVGSGLDVQGHD